MFIFNPMFVGEWCPPNKGILVIVLGTQTALISLPGTNMQPEINKEILSCSGWVCWEECWAWIFWVLAGCGVDVDHWPMVAVPNNGLLAWLPRPRYTTLAIPQHHNYKPRYTDSQENYNRNGSERIFSEEVFRGEVRETLLTWLIQVLTVWLCAIENCWPDVLYPW